MGDTILSVEVCDFVKIGKQPGKPWLSSLCFLVGAQDGATHDTLPLPAIIVDCISLNFKPK